MAAVLVLAAAGALGAAWLVMFLPPVPRVATSGTAAIGGPFTLVATTGERVTDQTFRGKWLVIFFGYTFCPDVCPTALNNISVALEKLGSDANTLQRVRLGEQQLVFFTAENLSDQAVVGHATFNVTPETTGIFFIKIQCFCFDEGRVNSYQKVDMPVVFLVDPALENDLETRDFDRIALSYTFFRSANPIEGRDASRLVAGGDADANRGQQVFAERCAACHGLDQNRDPLLADRSHAAPAGG